MCVSESKTTPPVRFGGPCEARINCPPPECKKGEFINPMTHKCVPKGTCIDMCVVHQPGLRFHCPPGATSDPSGAKKWVLSNNNDNIHSKSYQQDYQMGCSDGPDQENLIGTGGLAHHSKAFVQRYNDAFTHGSCPQSIQRPNVLVILY